MDIDVGTLVYIVLGIIYFIFQANSKNKKKREANRPSSQQQAQRQPANKPSFEELLEEFTGQKSRQPETVETEEEKYLEEEPFQTTDRPNYDIAKKEAEQRKRKADEEGKRIRSKFNDHFEPFEVEAETEEENDSYASMFNDLDSVKKAFVASEIFKRKF